MKEHLQKYKGHYFVVAALALLLAVTAASQTQLHLSAQVREPVDCDNDGVDELTTGDISITKPDTLTCDITWTEGGTVTFRDYVFTTLSAPGSFTTSTTGAREDFSVTFTASSGSANITDRQTILAVTMDTRCEDGSSNCGDAVTFVTGGNERGGSNVTITQRANTSEWVSFDGDGDQTASGRIEYIDQIESLAVDSTFEGTNLLGSDTGLTNESTFYDGNEPAAKLERFAPGQRIEISVDTVGTEPGLKIGPTTMQGIEDLLVTEVGRASIPENSSAIIKVNDETRRTEISSGSGTITFTAKDGNGRESATAELSALADPRAKLSAKPELIDGTVNIRQEAGTTVFTTLDGNTKATARFILDLRDEVRLSVDDSGENHLSISVGPVRMTLVNSQGEGTASTTLSADHEMTTSRLSGGGLRTGNKSGGGIETIKWKVKPAIIGVEILLISNTSGSTFAIIDDVDRPLLQPVCGNMICEAGETPDSCPADCTADMLIAPLRGEVSATCTSNADLTQDQCFPVRVEVVQNDVSSLAPANVRLIDENKNETLRASGLPETAAFSMNVDGTTVTGANALVLAPDRTSVEGNGDEVIFCGAMELEQGVVNVLTRYLFNGEQFCAPPSVGDQFEVLLHIVDKAGVGACTDGKKSCKPAIEGAEIRVYDRNSAEFQSAWGSKNPSGDLYDQIFEGNAGLVGTCTTGAEGTCTASGRAAESLAIMKYVDTETGSKVYIGRNLGDTEEEDTDGEHRTFEPGKTYEKDGSISFLKNGKTVIVR